VAQLRFVLWLFIALPIALGQTKVLATTTAEKKRGEENGACGLFVWPANFATLYLSGRYFTLLRLVLTIFLFLCFLFFATWTAIDEA